MPAIERPSAEDRLDILELFAQYAWAFDTGDHDGFVACFTPDAYYEMPGGRVFPDHQAIRGYVTTLTSSPLWAGRQHHIGQVIIRGNGERATVKSYALGTHRLMNGSCLVFFAGYYDDVVVKRDGRWLFARRVFSNWEGPVLDRLKQLSAR